MKKWKGYVVAGCDTLFGIMHQRKNEFFKENLDIKFVENVFNKFLYSYGSNLSKKSESNVKRIKSGKYIESIVNVLDSEYFKRIRPHSNIYLDSGGFQASTGYLHQNNIELFLESYCDFLQTYPECYSYAFSLDMLFVKEPLNTKENILKYNLMAYERMSRLPEHIRKKIIYVYHFRTPFLFKIWEALNKRYSNQFSDYYSMGGLVAYASCSKTMRFHGYTIPIVNILLNAIENGKYDIKIHILGGATYKDILLYKILEKHIKKCFNIDCKISFDSSAPFKQFQVARCTDFVMNDSIIGVSLKESDLKISYNGTTTEEIFLERVNFLLNKMEQNIQLELPLYLDNEDETKNGLNDLRKDFSLVGLLYTPYLYSCIEEYCDNKATILYDLYTNGELFEFRELLFDCMRFLNRGKWDNTRERFLKVENSLDVIKKLDKDLCQYVVDTVLVKDEFIY